MDDLTLVIKTHSDYSYLWPIIDDYIENIKLKKLLFHNKTENLPKNFDQYIEYDDKKIYMERLNHLTDSVKEDYILLIHDIDIIINLDENLLERYFLFMKEEKVDCLNLHISVGKEILEKEDLVICNLKFPNKSNHASPYDVSPSVWKKVSLKKMTENFSYLSYRDGENDKNLQNFIREHISYFCIDKKSNININYCRNLCFSKEFNFLHITTQGKFTYPVSVYMDNEKKFLEIKEKYNLVLKSSDVSKIIKGVKKL